MTFYDYYGRNLHDWEETRAMVDGMTSPVRCRCGAVYDLGKVEVLARYADCSVWKTPCCRRQVDDRGETGWKTFGDYTRLDRDGREVRR